jgi:hypothetical protein
MTWKTQDNEKNTTEDLEEKIYNKLFFQPFFEPQDLGIREPLNQHFFVFVEKFLKKLSMLALFGPDRLCSKTQPK